ncbi:MAG: trypsin-like serine protease [Actinomycetota bacterium]|nr:trypsin-like serine protease [Actinomycetota bacterium]
MRLTRLAATALLVLGLLTGLVTTSGSAAGAAPIPSARTVGPLFAPSVLGLGPTLGLPHYCSASVVHSRGHDLVLTAAHCVYGAGPGIEFAPGYHDGTSPEGVWTVTAAYLDPGWRSSRDPQHDFAILRVAAHGAVHVEDVTGGSHLAVAPAPGTPVTVEGYVAGSGGRPLVCTGTVRYTIGFPTFHCDGYAAGVSGGPWLSGHRVVGLIGGLHQGGCNPDTSYSPAFGPDIAALLTRADANGPGDLAPLPVSDGC